MPKVIVEIEWDQPDEQLWMNPDNIALALAAYCPNTKFKVRDNWGLLLTSDGQCMACEDTGYLHYHWSEGIVTVACPVCKRGFKAEEQNQNP